MKRRDCVTQILQRLAILVVCLDLALCQIILQDLLVQSRTSWFKAREFCQRHYVDLAVLSTEEQYFTLVNATAATRASFWLGLQRQSVSSGWKWVNGEELGYEHWYRRNYEGRCASLETNLEKDKGQLLARYCDELHLFVCQGPVSPKPVTVESVGSDHVILNWTVSASMQMTPHRYNVTTCTDTCDTLLFPYTDGSAFMNINISNLTAATAYCVEVSAFVVRPDSVTGGSVTLQSKPTELQVITVDCGGQHVVIFDILKFVCLAPSLWIVYCILKKKSPFLCDVKDSEYAMSPLELNTSSTRGDLIPTEA